MDIVLDLADHYIFDACHVYPDGWNNDYWLRQICSVFVIIVASSFLLYLLIASAVYYFFFDKRLEKHPLFLKNQKRREIVTSLYNLPLIGVFTVPLFFFEIRGYSQLYGGVPQGGLGWIYVVRDVIGFLIFTDFAIYWIHRGLHHRMVYRHFHKTHHIWKVPTPFASHAFNAVDGFMQSVPYHVYPFLFPLNKYAYLTLFVFVNMWTISIHDGYYHVPAALKPFVNGSAHHTDHHLYYNYNYGQYFTLWDRIGGSFKYPSAFEGKSLIKEASESLKKHED